MNDGPREHREARIIRARLFAANGKSQQFIIRSVSQHGLGGKVENGELAAGDRVTVALPRLGEVPATIRWTKGALLGLRTDIEMDIELLRFQQESLPAPPPPTGFTVAERFRPSTSTYRPGFRIK